MHSIRKEIEMEMGIVINCSGHPWDVCTNTGQRMQLQPRLDEAQAALRMELMRPVTVGTLTAEVINYLVMLTKGALIVLFCTRM